MSDKMVFSGPASEERENERMRSLITRVSTITVAATNSSKARIAVITLSEKIAYTDEVVSLSPGIAACELEDVE